DLDDSTLKTFAESMKERTFAPGQTVTEEHTGGVGFFVVADGTASVSVGGRNVGTIGPGDSFGEGALIADVERTGTVPADSELRCYGLTSWQFRPLVQSDAAILWKLLQTTARRLAAAEQRAAAASS